MKPLLAFIAGLVASQIIAEFTWHRYRHWWEYESKTTTFDSYTYDDPDDDVVNVSDGLDGSRAFLVDQDTRGIFSCLVVCAKDDIICQMADPCRGNSVMVEATARDIETSVYKCEVKP